MPLPSQTIRPIARRTHMHHKGRRRSIPRALLVVLLLLAGALIWTFWPDGEPGSDVEAPLLVAGVGTVDDLTPTIERIPDERTAPAPVGPDAFVGTPARAPGALTSPQATRETARGGELPPNTAMITPADQANAPADVPVEVPARGARVAIEEPRRTARSTPSRVPSAPADRATSSRRAARLMVNGFDLLDRNEPIEGRRVLSEALLSEQLQEDQAQRVRERLTALNERILFGTQVVPGDPFVFTYELGRNESLSILPRKLGVQTDWRFIQHINKIPSADRVRLGQRLKIVTGPFHAIVTKSAYRIDLYLGEEDERVYACSFPVGLGEFDSTPEGNFVVRPNSKLANPEWQNPRTGERFAADDPMNPIGEYWLGLDATDDHLAHLSGYGIHGTVDHDSIGKQASMGCVRLLPNDVEMVWFVLMPGVSSVEIR